MMKKLRVGVLMGGKSIEHEVSFNSGRTICDHLDTQRYEIYPIYQTQHGNLYILPWHFLHRGKTTDFVHRLDNQAQQISYDQLPTIIDFMYLAIHGWCAEDGTIQGMLEILHIPYLGTKVFGCAASLDKAIQKELLRQHNIQTPKHILLSATAIQHYDAAAVEQQLATAKLSFPVVVKPTKEGSSLGVSVVFAAEHLQQAAQKACFVDPRKKQDVLIEEKINGLEFCCIVITDYKEKKLLPLPVTEIVPEENTYLFDYQQKYMPGRSTKITPARCTQEQMKAIQAVSIQAMQALEFCNIARVDGFLQQDGTITILEVNSLTGTSPATFLFRQAAEIGMGHGALINHLIETELDSYGMLAAIEKQEQKTAMQQIKKLRIAVLLGGNSNEKEISLESGRNVVYKLSSQKYSIIPIFVSQHLQLYTITQQQLVAHATKEIEAMVQEDQKIQWSDLPNIADFVFNALHGGVGENGCVQGTLEMLALPYNGSAIFASALCMNKAKTNQFLTAKGFDVPRSFVMSKVDWEQQQAALIARIEDSIGFPCIIKPHDDGCSVGVMKITAASGLEKKLQTFFGLGKTHVMIEEFIQGMELTVGVLGNQEPKALVPSQTVSCGDILSMEEKFLPGQGENQTPAPLPAATIALIQKTIEQAYAAVGCKGYARIDCFYQTADQSPTHQERVVILEFNTLPALTPATCLFHQAAELGIKPMDLLDMIIQLGIQEYENYRILPTTISNIASSV